jgi:hypothetical protein
VASAYNPINWEVEAGGMQVSGQPGLPNKALFYKKRVGERKWSIILNDTKKDENLFS